MTRYAILIFTVLFALCPLPLWGQSQDPRKCMECHDPSRDTKVTTTDHAVHVKAQISCQICHGDDDIDPVRGEHMFKEGFQGRTWDLHFPTFCKTCHASQVDYFERGKHAEPTRTGKIRGCVECHDFRKTDPLVHSQPSRHRNLKEYCVRCHQDGSAGLMVGKTFMELFDEKEEGLNRTEDWVRSLASVPGVDVSTEQERLAEARKGFSRMRSAQHAMLAKEVIDLSRDIDQQRVPAEMALQRKETAVGQRILWLTAFLLLLTATAGVIILKFRRTMRNEPTENRP